MLLQTNGVETTLYRSKSSLVNKPDKQHRYYI